MSGFILNQRVTQKNSKLMFALKISEKSELKIQGIVRILMIAMSFRTNLNFFHGFLKQVKNMLSISYFYSC